jgi:hypothetical protein
VSIAPHLDWIVSQIRTNVQFTQIVDGPAAPTTGGDSSAGEASIPETPDSLEVEPLEVWKGTLAFSSRANKDSFSLYGRLAPLFPINPAAEGVTITLSNDTGVIAVFDLPPGAGWKSYPGPRWVFNDLGNGSLGTAGAVEDLTLKFNRTRSVFELSFKAAGLNWVGVDAGSLTTTVSIGTHVFENTRVWRQKRSQIVTP